MEKTTTNQPVEEEAFIQVNTMLLNDLNAKFTASPSRDMTDLLEHKAKTYPALRKVFRDGWLQAANESLDNSNSTRAVDVRDKFRVPTNAVILQPFSATVEQLALSDSGRGVPEVTCIDSLNNLVATSEIIWELGSTAVLGLNSALVMKVGNDIDLHHLPTMDFIKNHAPRVPIPDIHGILQQPNSTRVFLLMSRMPGEPLDSKWSSFTNNEKASIKKQLDVMIADFRFLPAPVTQEPLAILGGGSPRRCKDARRQIRIAPGPISNEAEFNEFLTSNSQPTEPGFVHMIRSYLRDNHQLVLTHGDLHPRNIMVSTSSQPHNSIESDTSFLDPHKAVNDNFGPVNNQVTITAILDWEMCGWYPEYWEYVKALNSITLGGDFSDWWTYLPQSIGVWPGEHAVDVMISRWYG